MARRWKESGLPRRVIGLSYDQWHVSDIELILEAHGVDISDTLRRGQRRNRKYNLLRRLYDLQQRENWSDRDRVSVMRNALRQNPRDNLASAPRIHQNLQPTLGATLSTVQQLSSSVLNPQDQTGTTDSRLCTICDEHLPSHLFPSRKVSDLCTHEPDCCIDCLKQSISSQAEWKIWNQMVCPSCHSNLEHKDIEDFSSREVRARYSELATLELLSDEPEFRRCFNCNAGQLHQDRDNQPIITCNQCGYKSCYTCEMAWGQNHNCETVAEERRAAAERVAEALRAENQANDAYFAQFTKGCPSSRCNRPVEKNRGCQHMTCSVCKHQYCWDCLADWRTIVRHGNELHEPTCPWFPPNLRPHPEDTPERLRQLVDEMDREINEPEQVYEDETELGELMEFDT